MFIRNQLHSVHGLRALAALLVVFHHGREQIDSFSVELPTEFGSGGVDIFFVISGLVMILSTYGRNPTRREFLFHRIKRVVPLYWFVTFLTAGIVIAAPSLMKNTSFSLPSLIQSLVFWPHYNIDKGNLSPLVKLGWTLNFEMLFYALFALFLPLRPILRLGAVAVCLGLLIAINMTFHPMVAPLRFWGSLMTLEFIMGMGIAIVYVRGSLARFDPHIALIIAALGVLSLIILADTPADRLFTRGLPAAAIIFGLVAAEANGRVMLTGPVIAFLGNASYAIYLGHLFFVRFAGVCWSKAGLAETGVPAAIGFVVLVMIGGTIAGILLHLLVERPLAGLITRVLPDTRPKHAAGDYETGGSTTIPSVRG